MHDMQTPAGAPLSATPTDDASSSSPEPDEPPTPSTPSGPRWALFGTVLVAAALILGLDQATKSWVVAHLDPATPRDLVGSLLRLHLTFNPGAAFNMATGATWVLTLIASAVVVVTIVTARRLGSRAWSIALGLLLGGALGNLSDRLFRYPGGGRGHVVDFLQLPHWPIFNVADMAVVSAAILIAVLAFLGIGLDGQRAGATPGRHAADRRTDDGHQNQSDQPDAEGQGEGRADDADADAGAETRGEPGEAPVDESEPGRTTKPKKPGEQGD